MWFIKSDLVLIEHQKNFAEDNKEKFSNCQI